MLSSNFQLITILFVAHS